MSFYIFIFNIILVQSKNSQSSTVQQTQNDACPINQNYVIPIISLNDLSLNNSKFLMSTLNNTGCFYLKDHGISSQIIDEALNGVKMFFAYSNDLKSQIKINKNQRGWLDSVSVKSAKMKYTNISDYKQVLFFGPDIKENDPDIGKPMVALNQWPNFMQELPSKIYPYYNEVMRVGDIVLEAVAIGLGVKQQFFKQYYTKSLGRGQLLYYPVPTDRKTQIFGVGPHTDLGMISIILQDDKGGLQFFSRLYQEWIDVKPIDGTLIINIGDMLEIWSGFKLRSTIHRVINGNRTRARYGISIFHDPNSEALIDAHDIVKDDDPNIGNVKFEDVFSAGDYINDWNHKLFAHYSDNRYEQSRESVQNDMSSK
eukprot:164696_1